MHIWLVLLSILLVPVHSMDTSSGSKGPLTIVEASSPVAQLSPVYGEQMTAMAQLEVEDVGAQDMAIDRDYSRHGNDNNNNDNSNNNGNNDNTNTDGANNRGKSFISTPEDPDTTPWNVILLRVCSLLRAYAGSKAGCTGHVHPTGPLGMTSTYTSRVGMAVGPYMQPVASPGHSNRWEPSGTKIQGKQFF